MVEGQMDNAVYSLNEHAPSTLNEDTWVEG